MQFIVMQLMVIFARIRSTFLFSQFFLFCVSVFWICGVFLFFFFPLFLVCVILCVLCGFFCDVLWCCRSWFFFFFFAFLFCSSSLLFFPGSRFLLGPSCWIVLNLHLFLLSVMLSDMYWRAEITIFLLKQYRFHQIVRVFYRSLSLWLFHRGFLSPKELKSVFLREKRVIWCF